MNVRQPEISALETERELRVFEPEQMQESSHEYRARGSDPRLG